MFSSLFVFLLFGLVFIFLPLKPFQFEVPKVLLAEIIIGIIFVSFILKNKIKEIKISKYLLISTLIIFILTLIDLIFFKTSISLFGNQFRLQGIFLLWNFLLLAILSSLIPVQVPKTSWLIILLLIELVISLILGFTLDGRIIGTLGEPNALASCIVFLFPFILFSPKSIKSLKIAGFAVALLILFLTGSRSGLIAFSIELIAFFLSTIQKINIKKISIFLFVIILISLVLPFFDKETSLLENRKEIWKVSFSAGLTKPLFGFGFGNIEYALHSQAQKINSPIQYIYVDSSHNIILDWWIQGGLIGLITFCFLILSTIFNFVRKKEIIYITTFLGLLVTLLFNPGSVIALLELWWLIGISFAYDL